MYIKYFISLTLAMWLIGHALAQEKAESPKEPQKYKPIKIDVTKDGAYYLRILTWAQLWTTFVDNNPGTIGYDLKPDNSSASIGIRRARMLFYAQM